MQPWTSPFGGGRWAERLSDVPRPGGRRRTDCHPRRGLSRLVGDVAGDARPAAPATGPAVFPASPYRTVSAPTTPRDAGYIDGTPLTDRSTPFPQPRAAREIVADLHGLFAAGGIASSFLMVGHSLGGLIARAYAQTHADQFRDLVFVDAFSATILTVFGSRWPIYRDRG